jgi:hypothetical protein
MMLMREKGNGLVWINLLFNALIMALWCKALLALKMVSDLIEVYYYVREGQVVMTLRTR